MIGSEVRHLIVSGDAKERKIWAIALGVTFSQQDDEHDQRVKLEKALSGRMSGELGKDLLIYVTDEVYMALKYYVSPLSSAPLAPSPSPEPVEEAQPEKKEPSAPRSFRDWWNNGNILDVQGFLKAIRGGKK